MKKLKTKQKFYEYAAQIFLCKQFSVDLKKLLISTWTAFHCSYTFKVEHLLFTLYNCSAEFFTCCFPSSGRFYCLVSLRISLVSHLFFFSASHQVTAGGGYLVIVRQLYALWLQFGCRQLSRPGLCHCHISNIIIILNLIAVVIMEMNTKLKNSQYVWTPGTMMDDVCFSKSWTPAHNEGLIVFHCNVKARVSNLEAAVCLTMSLMFWFFFFFYPSCAPFRSVPFRSFRCLICHGAVIKLWAISV